MKFFGYTPILASGIPLLAQLGISSLSTGADAQDFVSYASYSANGEGFSDWKNKYGKTYDSPDVEAKKFQTWLANHEIVIRQNAKAAQGLSSFTVALNRFADLNSEEYQMLLLGARPAGRAPMAQSTFTREHATQVNVPDDWNWVDQGIVPEVKDQGQCGK